MGGIVFYIIQKHKVKNQVPTYVLSNKFVCVKMFYLIEKMKNFKHVPSLWIRLQNLNYKARCQTEFIQSMEGAIPFVYPSRRRILDWIHWLLAWKRTLALPLDSFSMLMTNSLRLQTGKWGFTWNLTKVLALKFRILKLKPFKSSISLEENHHAGDWICKELLISF